MGNSEEEFVACVRSVEPGLRISLTAGFGFDRGLEATNDALVHGWRNWERVRTVVNPTGYLFRVAQRKARRRRLVPDLLSAAPVGRDPWFEPALSQVLRRLSARQRQVVVLVEAYQWPHREVADLLGIRPSSVQTHYERALTHLRDRLGAGSDGRIAERLRVLFQDAAPPVDLPGIPRAETRVSPQRPRARAVAAAVLVLAVGGATVVLATTIGIDLTSEPAPETVPASETAPASDTAAAFETPPSSETPTTEQQGQGAYIEWARWSSPPAFNPLTLSSAGGRFFASTRPYLEDPDAQPLLWSSADGSSWKAVDIDASRFGMRNGYIAQVVSTGDNFTAIFHGDPLVTGDSSTLLLVSADAQTWQRIDTGSPEARPLAVAADPNAGAIAFVGTYGGSGYTYDVWYSANGTDWTQTTSDAFQGIAPYPRVVVFGGAFYIVALRDDGPPSLLTSTDGAEWRTAPFPPLSSGWIGAAIPIRTQAGLILFTGGTSRSQLWLRSTSEDWTEVTPPGFDAWPDPSGNSVINPPAGELTLIVDTGSSGGQINPGYYKPPSIWWTLDGLEWSRLGGSDFLGFDGVISGAAAEGDRIVLLVRSHPDLETSIWTGEVVRRGGE